MTRCMPNKRNLNCEKSDSYTMLLFFKLKEWVENPLNTYMFHNLYYTFDFFNDKS